MRRAPLFAFALLLGCARAPEPIAPAAAPAPPVSSPREDDVQAEYGLETACAAVEESVKGAKALAPVAGGEAGDALRGVAEGLDAAGAALSDVEPPPAGRAYTDAERKAVAQAAADALGELRDAGDILDGLAQNAPPAHEKALTTIRASVAEAEDAVEEAMGELGAKASPGS